LTKSREYRTAAEQWLELRKIRNVLSHTYEDEPEEMSIAINDIFYKKEAIEKYISIDCLQQPEKQTMMKAVFWVGASLKMSAVHVVRCLVLV